MSTRASAGTLELEGRLAEGAALLGLAIPRERLRLSLRLLDLLAEWGQAYNLTSVRDPERMLTHHLLDSLSVAPFLLGGRVLDLGTGAGLPGLPLALAAPDRGFWLLDSSGKKIRFVRHAVLQLGLTNVVAVQTRVEAYRPQGNFSTIVARAIASVAEIYARTARLLASPGRLLVMKGRLPAEELAHPALTGLDLAVHPLDVPFLKGQRHLIEIRRD